MFTIVSKVFFNIRHQLKQTEANRKFQSKQFDVDSFVCLKYPFIRHIHVSRSHRLYRIHVFDLHDIWKVLHIYGHCCHWFSSEKILQLY